MYIIYMCTHVPKCVMILWECVCVWMDACLWALYLCTCVYELYEVNMYIYVYKDIAYITGNIWYGVEKVT